MAGPLYLQVLIEAIHRASLVPMASEATLYAMKSFGGYNLWLAIALAIIGGTAGQIFNFALGALLKKIRKKNGWNLSESLYEKAQGIFRKYLIFLLLFSWATGGNILVAIAGFLGIRLAHVAPVIVIGYIFHYASQLL